MATQSSGTESRQRGNIQHKGRAPSDDQLARALGWFSIGLGLWEAVAPQTLTRSIGVEDNETIRRVVRGLGVREIIAGTGILTMRQRPAGWLWTRAAGDAMDLALLGLALSSRDTKHDRAAAATAAVVGVTALDVFYGLKLGRGAGARRARGTVEVTKTITVNRPPKEVYRFWRDFENLPRFMGHLEEVRSTGGARSHWRAKGPAGMSVEWDAEITEDVPDERIAWRSLEGADVDNAGTVQFKRGPGGRGTEVKVELRYAPPGGRAGALVAGLLGEAPGQQIREELRAFKQLMETSEIARSDASFGWLAHAAQPPEK